MHDCKFVPNSGNNDQILLYMKHQAIVQKYRDFTRLHEGFTLNKVISATQNNITFQVITITHQIWKGTKQNIEIL